MSQVGLDPRAQSILVADDMPENLRLLSHILREHGFRVRPALSGETALRSAYSELPDLILLDIMMPTLDGYEVCRQLKADDRTRDIPVIFVSAPSEVFDKVKAFSVGGVDYITKPFQEEEVVMRVENHLVTRNLQRCLELQNTRLEQEIAERIRTEKDLQQVKEAAEAENYAKSAFLANMSHELRTPLTAILGFVQLIGHNSNLSSEDQENLRIIQRNGEHLLSLIRQVLDLSKIESGKMTLNLQEFDLSHVLDDIEQTFAYKAEQKNLSLHFEYASNVPQFIRADELKLRQVLLNLLNNAIKFTNEGGVSLRVQLIEKRKEQQDSRQSSRIALHFSVEDTGPGIAEEEFDTLFEAFRQTETGKQTQGGTGLGLALSRKFIQLMGGELCLESLVGQRTTFSFDMPCTALEQMPRRQSESSNRIVSLQDSCEKYRLLVAEDNADNRKIFVRLLAPFGFQIREATTGLEAVKIWKQWQPHVIWMNVRMPEMDGYEATERIKTEDERMKSGTTYLPDSPTPVIIALSASSFESERAQAYMRGCDDFLRKPFLKSEIFALLAKHLEISPVYEVDKPQHGERRSKNPAKFSYSALMLPLTEKCRRDFGIAIDRLDVDMAMKVIHSIQEKYPEAAEKLTELIKAYRFDVLHDLLHSGRVKEN
ncbi:hybrid sensor histidine kinase/response regulator [candidate division KSB3 bacterium]|uniref:histidine kinase n=1 Tax=candidate division KSB3 bacterium TaxID=2044937 RepID=A0A2G6KDY1_9BACT|nr:MAG: hybrid sensor histidine kinase/response regulator [candidate division KSB3 bacterium]